MFGNITPNCRSASACSLKVSLASELLLTRSWHHRGSGVTPPSHLSNEYFDKFVRWRERHINLSDHNLRDKAFKFGVGELRTTLCTCRPLDHFTCEPLCHLCHRFHPPTWPPGHLFSEQCSPSQTLIASAGALHVATPKNVKIYICLNCTK